MIRSTKRLPVVYIIRHAHASAGEDDAVRPLSRRGREQIQRVARFLKKSGSLTAREFWHSPLVRSRDTAKRLVKHLKIRAKLTEVEGLLHDDPPGIMAKRLARVRRSVAVVGHEPHLGTLVSLLVANVDQPARFELRKADVIALTRFRNRWRIQWHLTPRLLGVD
jgi:phosphohistidine phosphatase